MNKQEGNSPSWMHNFSEYHTNRHALSVISRTNIYKKTLKKSTAFFKRVSEVKAKHLRNFLYCFTKNEKR